MKGKGDAVLPYVCWFLSRTNQLTTWTVAHFSKKMRTVEILLFY